MNNIQIFSNEELKLKVRTIQNEDRSISVNAEDAAKGFGWIQIKNNKEYVRWETINSFIDELNLSQHVGKDDYIPESLFYMLGMKASNKVAQDFQKWLAVDVIPSIRKTGGYIGANENMTDEEIMAKALMVAQKTITKKDELLKAKEKELAGVKEDLNVRNKFINQIAISENSLLVREVAKIASKQGVVIGEKRLWEKLREWGFIFKKSTEAKQEGIDRGYFEVVEGSRTSNKKTFTYHTTRITGKGQVYIINRLLKELEIC